MIEIRQIEKAIAALETQRHLLGDATLENALAPLRARLGVLRTRYTMSEVLRKNVLLVAVKINNLNALPEHFQKTWQADARQIIQTWGGFVEQETEDAWMISWGFDISREENPERAIRAALELKRIAGTLQPPGMETNAIPGNFQCGIHTIGVLTRSDSKKHDVGLLTRGFNITRQILSCAPLNGILVTHDTYSQVQGVFNIQKQPPIALDGLAEELDVYLVLGYKPRAFHIPARSVEGIISKTVGQSQKLDQLVEGWKEVLATRQAHCFTIIGEAGFGKSRLMDDLRVQLEYRGEPYRYFEGRSSPQTNTIPYALVRDILVNRFQIYNSDLPAVAREKLISGIVELSDEGNVEKAHVLGELLNFDFSSSPYLTAIHQDASQIRQRALQYLIDFFTTVSHHRTVALFLDNIHWADSASIEMLRKLAFGLRNQPLMLVVMARPELLTRVPDWGGDLPNHQRIDLTPLSITDARELTNNIFQKLEMVPQVLTEAIAQGSGGNPYYIEEMVKYLVDSRVISPDEPNWFLDPNLLANCRIPTSVEDVIAARIERLLPQEQDTLYAASVAGRVFWDSMAEKMLTGAEQTDSTENAATLASIQRREIVFHRPTSTFAGVEEYIFKHHVLHDVTYRYVPADKKPLYHARAAQWLLAHDSKHGDEYPSWIAYHLEKAGEAGQAGTWYLRAGAQAADRYANLDALWLLGRALSLLPEDAVEERFQATLRTIRLQNILGQRGEIPANLSKLHDLALACGGGTYLANAYFAQAQNEEVDGEHFSGLESCKKAAALLENEPPSRLITEIHILTAEIHTQLQNLEYARQHFLTALELSKRVGLTQITAIALRKLGNICWHERKYDESCDLYQQALHIFHEIGDLRGESQTHLNLGTAHINLHKFDLGQQHLQHSLDLSRRIGERVGEARALNNWGDLYASRGEFESAADMFKHALTLYQEVNYPIGIGVVLANLGFTHLQIGYLSTSLEYFLQWFNFCQALPDPKGMAMACTSLAQILMAIGLFGRARNYLNQAMTYFNAMEDWIGKCRVLSMLGRTAYLSGDIPTALTYEEEAIQCAQQPLNYENLWLAYITLGHIYTDQGKLGLAHEAYQKMDGVSQKMRDTHLLVEPHAARARLALKEERLQDALAEVELILERLNNPPLDYSDAIFWAYLVCAEVLNAADDPRRRDVLYRAQRTLYSLAEKIADPDIRKSFLENVVANRKIANMRLT